MERVPDNRRETVRTNKVSNALIRGFVVFVFLLASTGALIPLLRQKGGSVVDVSGGDPITQAVWLMVYATVLFLIASRWRRFVGVIMNDKFLLLLVSIALVSVLWSAAPEVTLRRSVALVGTTAIGAYLAMRYTVSGQLRLLAWALGIAALLSWVFGLLLPSYGISNDPLFQGDWQGIFNHKKRPRQQHGTGRYDLLYSGYRQPRVSMARVGWLRPYGKLALALKFQDRFGRAARVFVSLARLPWASLALHAGGAVFDLRTPAGWRCSHVALEQCGHRVRFPRAGRNAQRTHGIVVPGDGQGMGEALVRIWVQQLLERPPRRVVLYLANDR